MTIGYVLRIARKSLLARKTRTMVTIGGIVIGVSAIVFLVSLGYGLQELVTTQVAQLDALSMTEVSSEKPSVLKITDETLRTLKGLANVEEAVPIVNVAGKVSYQNSTTDSVIFGAPVEYLKLNSIHPTGQFYSDTGEVGQQQQAIINGAMVKVLNIATNDEALDKKFSLSVVLTSAIAPDLETTEAAVTATNTNTNTNTDATATTAPIAQDSTTRQAGEYTVVGVVQDNAPPSVYVRLSDLTSFGVTNYNQVTVRIKDQASLDTVRKSIETLGFKTTSVVDTVVQINSIFSVFRIVLAAVGAIALVIAALGMFNTLTVSLLERTREIGFMKALGTNNYDVLRIFLSEAIIIAVTGGLVGVMFGYYLGEGVNFVLNWFAQRTGNPTVDIFFTPLSFAGIVLVFSFVVGFLTGLFPARRAARIQPLDALRYE